MSPAAGVATLGLLAALAGCANTPTRLATLEAAAAPALVAPADGSYQAPVPVSTVRPQYPFAMKRNGISEVINVSCLVDETGRVVDAKVGKSTDLEFGQPAIDALKKWSFQPARRDGVPVAQWVMIPFNFTFDD